MCASFKVLWCASFEVPCDVHPSRCLVLCDVLGKFVPEFCRVLLLWGSWRKTSPPHSLRFHCRRTFLYAICYLGRRSLGWFLKKCPPLPNELLPGGIFCRSVCCFDIRFVCQRGNARKLCFLWKNVSPLSFALLSSRVLVLFVLGKSNDGYQRFLWEKCPPPLSGIHLSIFPR